MAAAGVPPRENNNGVRWKREEKGEGRVRVRVREREKANRFVFKKNQQNKNDFRMPVLNQLGSVASVDAVLNHLVEAEDGASLQHPTKDGLLAHQIRLYFRHLCCCCCFCL